MKYQIVDLDGCISDDRWRRHLIDSAAPPQQRFHEYHLRCCVDGARNLHELMFKGEVIILTARPLAYRHMTMAWLKDIAMLEPRIAIFRNNHDYRPSVEVKRTMLNCLFDPNQYNVNQEDISSAIDDRETIVQMYQSFNLPARVVRIGLEEHIYG